MTETAKLELYGNGHSLWVDLLFEPRDIWIGVFWKHERWTRVWDFYICLVPCFPIRILVNNQPKW